MEGVAGPPSALPAVLAFPEGDSLAAQFLRAELELNARLRELVFPEPVCYVYNPLEYAWEPHQDYVRRYCRPSADVLFLGMNPGPFGMAQTGADLPASQREALLRACDDGLARAAGLLGVSLVIGVGRLAEQRARKALAAAGLRVRVEGLLHPSPRSPQANKGWEAMAKVRLAELGVLPLPSP
ncbi:single-strand selective monofunctional uracil DNA glycosylase [Alligator sinensis]|uniref:Single-strand selective monofunctional uracil DNA glycosylase n=1 Tax=Alligator sinensis TaxID=38654 RepID=A0A3Q0FJ46_ALLSI|nr:single-strand selective monofunctional uracil DNA glycosylase [Alligator sinensis]